MLSSDCRPQWRHHQSPLRLTSLFPLPPQVHDGVHVVDQVVVVPNIEVVAVVIVVIIIIVVVIVIIAVAVVDNVGRHRNRR